MGKLREAFPNVLHLERPGLFRSGEVQVAGRERLSASEWDLFASFFREMTGDELSEEPSRVFDAVVQDSLKERAKTIQQGKKALDDKRATLLEHHALEDEAELAAR
jgi:hypothetical protein